MYAPLDYMEQIREMVGVDGSICEDFSKKTVDFYTKLFNDENVRNLFVYDFSKNFYKLNGTGLEFKNIKSMYRYIDIRSNYYSYLGLPDALKVLCYKYDSDYDFLTMSLQQFIYYDWRFHKLTYKLSNYLGKQLASMPLPANVFTSCFINLPATTFCVDLSDTDLGYCKDLKCIFVSSGRVGNEFCIVLTILIEGRHNRLMPLFLTPRTILAGDESEDKPMLLEIGTGDEKCKLQFEDGIYRTVDVMGIQLFVTNFLIYLSACNKDIEPHPAVKENFNKPVNRNKECKNKFRELRLNQVGYRISSPIPKKQSNVVECKGKGSPKSAHYRSAHWHHYWTGSGDNKQLIVKWIEGLFVNGKAEQDVAVVHKM